MEDFKEKAEVIDKEIKESFKEGAGAFLDDVVMDKHLMDEISDEKRAEKAAKRAAKKEKIESAFTAVLDSFRQGIEEFKSDAAVAKDSFDEIAAEKKAEDDSKKAAKKDKFDNTVADLKESLDQGADEFKADGAVLIDSLTEIAAEAGIDVKENETVASMLKIVRDSFAEGFDAFKSDASFTKAAFEDAADEVKAQKAAEKAERKEKFDDAVEAAKESAQQGAEAFKSDAAFTKAAFEEASEELKAQKEAKREAGREEFDETIKEIKEGFK